VRGTGKRKTYFEESESDLPADIDGNEPYDDDFSDHDHYFTDRDVCLIWRECETDVTHSCGAHCEHSRIVVVRIHVRAILTIC
jgi:hypothetical protein